MWFGIIGPRVEPLFVVMILIINSALSELLLRWMMAVYVFQVPRLSRNIPSTTNSLSINYH